MLSLLNILLTILSPSLASRGLTIKVGEGFYKGAKSYTESDVAAK
jgi:hypothetical protein